MPKLDVDKVFVPHWDKLVDRKAFMEGQFAKNGIMDVSWVTAFPAGEVEDHKDRYPLIFEARKIDTNLRPPIISLLLKHCWVIEEMVRQKYTCALILEDDAILVDDFITKFNRYKEQLPEDWDLLWVGTCCDIHALNIRSNSNIYDGSKSRCTHCFLVSLQCAQKIHDDMYRADTAIDWYYNTLIKRHSLRSFWAEPALSFQNNSFKTTLQS